MSMTIADLIVRSVAEVTGRERIVTDNELRGIVNRHIAETFGDERESRSEIAESFISYVRGQAIGDPFGVHEDGYNEGVAACARILEDQLTSRPITNRATDLLRLVLPMAKGYAAAHPVGDNAGKVREAEDFLSGHSSPTKALDGVNRVEVIDHRGRAYAIRQGGLKVSTSIQDEGRTLKVFIALADGEVVSGYSRPEAASQSGSIRPHHAPAADELGNPITQGQWEAVLVQLEEACTSARESCAYAEHIEMVLRMIATALRDGAVVYEKDGPMHHTIRAALAKNPADPVTTLAVETSGVTMTVNSGMVNEGSIPSGAPGPVSLTEELRRAAKALLAQLDRVGMTREEEPLMDALRAALANHGYEEHHR